MFTRLDSERNAKIMKRAVNDERLDTNKYKDAVTTMDEYVSLPAKRLGHLVRKYVHHSRMKDIEENVKKSKSLDENVFEILDKMEALQNKRAKRWADKMDDMGSERMRLANLLMETLDSIEQESGILVNLTVVSLPPRKARWLKFESLLPDIQDFIDNVGREDGEVQWHIGGGVFVSLSSGYPTVDIRHFWKPDDAPEPIPTKKGVTLNRNKLARLRDALNEIHECVPELQDTELCMFSDSHQNQIGMLNCTECTPFGYDDQDNRSMECNVGDLQDTESIESDLD
uniref:Transcriptional coactivator p15 (PC4) C-terminal domain-containing protein n=1 Tax=Magallana gigas TaxID=29159 RepID=A0A8W8P1B1_MAGGI